LDNWFLNKKLIGIIIIIIIIIINERTISFS